MINNNQESLKEFREQYIIKKSTELANTPDFIKGFILNQISEYTTLLSLLVTKNNTELQKLIENEKNEKNENFFKILGFIFEIPKLINIKGSEVNINSKILDKNFFKIIDDEKIKELKLNLNEIDQKFQSVIFNSYESNFSTLYKSGEFILNFLNVLDVRREIAAYLLRRDFNINDPEFEKELRQWLIEKRIKMNNNSVWNSTQRIQNFLY